MKRYVLGLDEGTTSLRAVLYDIDANKIVLSKSSAISMFYPQDAWVEQDAEEIYQAAMSKKKDFWRLPSQISAKPLWRGINSPASPFQK